MNSYALDRECEAIAAIVADWNASAKSAAPFPEEAFPVRRVVVRSFPIAAIIAIAPPSVLPAGWQIIVNAFLQARGHAIVVPRSFSFMR